MKKTMSNIHFKICEKHNQDIFGEIITLAFNEFIENKCLSKKVLAITALYYFSSRTIDNQNKLKIFKV